MPRIGEQAPDFELLNQDGKKVKLSDFRGKPVIVFAFPKANTAGCNAQACGFRDQFPNFGAVDAVILGISRDAPETLRAWKKDKNLPYDLLSDPGGKVMSAWGAKNAAVAGYVFMLRSHWVIDSKGVVVDAQIGVLPNVSAAKALKALEQLKTSA